MTSIGTSDPRRPGFHDEHARIARMLERLERLERRAASRILVRSAAVNIPSTAAGGVGNMDVTVTGLAVGDFCFLVGRSGIDARGFGVWTRSIVTVADTITIDYVNAQASTADPGSTTMHFLCVRP